MIVGVLFGGLLPDMLDIPVPNLAFLGNLMGFILYGVAIQKWSLFELNIEVIAKNIVSTIADLLIVVDHNGIITIVNSAACSVMSRRSLSAGRRGLFCSSHRKRGNNPFFVS